MEASIVRLVLISCIMHTATSSPCLNNKTFKYSSSNQKCDWIRWNEGRRQDLCQLEEIRSNCPQSCGLCCEDDPLFEFLDESSISRNCSWIEEFSMNDYCNRRRNQTTVKFRCPLACDICKTEVQIIMDPPPPPPNGSNSNNRNNTGIIIGSVMSAISVLGVIALHKRFRNKDEINFSIGTITQTRTKQNATDVEETLHEESTKTQDSEDKFMRRGIPPDGVSIFWIKNVFLQQAKEHGLVDNDALICDIEDVNSDQNHVLRSIGENFVCPRDGEVGAAIVDSIDKEEHTGPSNLILNYSEGVSVADVVGTLWDFCFFNNYDAKLIYVWAPFLCTNFHRLNGKSKKNVSGLDLRSSLRKRITSIGRVLTIVSPWVQPQNFLSVCGIYALYAGIDIGCKVIITTATRDRNKLITTSLRKEDELINLFKTIDQIKIQDAISCNTLYDESILRLVRFGAGYDRVNGKVCTRLRRWAKEEVMKALKHHEGRSKDALKDEDFAFLCSEVAYALIRVEEGTDAISLYNKALTIYKNARGDTETDGASLYMNAGMVLQATGDLKGAIKEYNKVLDIHQSVYGEEHIETSNTYNYIGMAMEADEDLRGAVDNYKKALMIREKVCGSQNPYTGK